MIQIPSFLDCFLKLSDYLGLAYSEKVKGTEKARIKELNDFNEQGGYFTNFYCNELNNLLAINDKSKQDFISNWIEISENFSRRIICQNYYTITSSKRMLWALIIYYYIPNIACFISIYDKEFGIPICLSKNNFMLPYSDSDKIILPTEQLKIILNTTVKNITIKDVVNIGCINTLIQYLHNFNKTSIPQYRTKQAILDEIKSTKELDHTLDNIDRLFQSAIVSGSVFNDLASYFGHESYAIELIEYFKKFLAVFDGFLYKDVAIINDFDNLLATHFEFYQYEFQLINHEKESPHHQDPEALCAIKDIRAGRDGCQSDLLSVFDAFLRTTRESDSDALEEIETEKCEIGMFRCRLPTELEPIDNDHEDIISLLSDLGVIFSSPEDVLNESEIKQLFYEIESHKFYSVYEHLYLYYVGLNKLGMNDLNGAMESLKSALAACSKVTAGETQLEVSYTLIIVKLLAKKTISYSKLNNELTAIMNVTPIRRVLYVDIDRLKEIEENISNKNQDKSKKILNMKKKHCGQSFWLKRPI